MCSMYWNLHAPFTCPRCGAENGGADPAQTHFMGEAGSCCNVYVLGQPVHELADCPDMVLDPASDDWLSADCEECGEWVNLGAEIRGGAVVRVWVLAPELAREET